MAEIDAEPQKGDWVRVWALVLDPSPHPEEYAVRFESHNQHSPCLVRRDHVQFKPGKVPDFVDRCFAVWHADDHGDLYVRCARPHEHGGQHRVEVGPATHVWDDHASSGYIEVC